MVDLILGQHVICDGYIGKISEICKGNERGMAKVSIKDNTVTVSISELIPVQGELDQDNVYRQD